MSKTGTSLCCVKPVMAATPNGEISGSRWAPNTDVYQVEEGLVVMVELAGIRREDLEIAVEGNRVIISGQRPDSCRGPNCRFLMMEINYGHFESLIELPAGYDLGKAKASYQNGFLRVDIPQAGPLTDVTREPAET